jgi:hypothetical protein
MNGQDIRDACEDLGYAWGLGRPLCASELGRVVRLTGRDPGLKVTRWQSDRSPVQGPVSLCIEMMLAGAMSPELTPAEAD